MVADHAEGGACGAITQVFELLGKRWTGLIVVTLLDGPARFSRIVQLVPGMSERMLSERLTELSAAGLITREVEDGPPVNVRYALTSRGEALRPALAELERWGHEQLVKTTGPAGRAGPGPDDAVSDDAAVEPVSALSS
jgi:DNA-binding HxlR family transcriptional regulator